MKFASLIDYANLSITLKKNLSLSQHAEVEAEICRILESVDRVLSDKGISLVKRIAYVLDDRRLGNPEETLASCNYEVKRVEDERSDKTAEMRNMKQSRLDDETLMADALELTESLALDGVLVLTNDGDYSSLGEKLRYAGRYFWVGVHEGRQRAAWRLRNIADLMLPLREIVDDVDEPEPLPMDEADAEELTKEYAEPHLVLYHQGRVVLTYPLNKDVVEIGRRSSRRFHFPQIDLTDLDVEKIVSRQHVTVRRLGERWMMTVHANCSRGTWAEGLAVYPCEQFLLESGMQVVLGSADGYGLEYIGNREDRDVL